MKKKDRGKSNNNDGGLTSLKETREKLLKSDDQVVSIHLSVLTQPHLDDKGD